MASKNDPKGQYGPRIKPELGSSEPGASTYELYPHEFLLHVTRGLPVKQCRYLEIVDEEGNTIQGDLVEEDVYPPMAIRIDAAKSSAKYYAIAKATKMMAEKRETAGGDLEQLLLDLAEDLPV